MNTPEADPHPRLTQTQIDPCGDGIRAHACLRHIPLWPDNSPRMESLRRELQETGLCQPVQMTPRHEIVDPDSRERWRAARMLQLESIAVAFVPQDQAATACLNALLHRRHQTKSALAYLAFPLVEEALEESSVRRVENLKNANVFSKVPQCTIGGTAEALADHYGFGRRFLFEAKKVHEIFAKDAAFKAQMEPRLLADPTGGEHEQNRPPGLGAIIAGYAGKRNEDKARPERQLELWLGTHLRGLSFRAARLADFGEFRRGVEAWLDEHEDQIEQMQKIGETIAAAARARAKQHKPR